MNTIILGTNHNNTLGLVWSLGEAGHRVVLVLYSNGNNYVSKSKYISKTYLIGKDDDVITLIKEISSGMDSKPVVFVSNDGDASLLNEHYEELIDYCYFEGGRPDGSINRYRDKDEGERLARECGFVIPQTVVISKPEELADVTLPYPLFIKGNNSVHGGKAAMKKCDTPQVAEDFVKSLPQDYFPLQVQEFIEKEYELMLLGCSLYGGKKVICPVANKKIRQYPKYVGLGAFSESVQVSGNPELEHLAECVARYMKDTGYTGNFSVEFLYSQGKYYFLEANLRNDGTSYLSTASGFNLPDMVCRSFYTDDVTTEGMTFSHRNYMNVMAEFHAMRDKEVSFFSWLKEFNRHTVYSHYNRNDKKPFWGYIN